MAKEYFKLQRPMVGDQIMIYNEAQTWLAFIPANKENLEIFLDDTNHMDDKIYILGELQTTGEVEFDREAKILRKPEEWPEW